MSKQTKEQKQAAEDLAAAEKVLSDAQASLSEATEETKEAAEAAVKDAQAAFEAAEQKVTELAEAGNSNNNGDQGSKTDDKPANKRNTNNAGKEGKVETVEQNAKPKEKPVYFDKNRKVSKDSDPVIKAGDMLVCAPRCVGRLQCPKSKVIFNKTQPKAVPEECANAGSWIDIQVRTGLLIKFQGNKDEE